MTSKEIQKGLIPRCSSRASSIAVLILLLLTFVLSAASCSHRLMKVDLSSPEATIMTYCTADKIDVINLCLYGVQFDKSQEKKIWTDCTIVKKEKTKYVGKSLGSGTNLHIKETDIEITKEVTMIDPKRNNPRTRYWYLLRKFGDEWKIISHSHISDENYPAYD